MGVDDLDPIFDQFVEAKANSPIHHATAYGVFCAAANIDLENAFRLLLIHTDIRISCYKR